MVIGYHTYLLSPSCHRVMQFFHPFLSSARFITSVHVISMHRMSSRIVSCQFFRGLPLLRFPSRLQSMACSPSILATCPIQHSLLLLLMMFPIPSCPVLSHISLFLILSLQVICILSHLLCAASSFFLIITEKNT